MYLQSIEYLHDAAFSFCKHYLLIILHKCETKLDYWFY